MATQQREVGPVRLERCDAALSTRQTREQEGVEADVRADIEYIRAAPHTFRDLTLFRRLIEAEPAPVDARSHDPSRSAELPLQYRNHGPGRNEAQWQPGQLPQQRL